MHYQAVVFDMDGTLFDTERVFADGWRAVGQKHGIDIPDEVILEAVGKPRKETNDLFNEKIPGYDWDALFHECMAWAHDLVEQDGMPQKGNVAALLDHLHAEGKKTAIASSTEHARILRNLEHANLAGRFDAIVGGDEVESGKPAPDPYLKAAKLLGVDPGECVVVEDSASGVRSAHAAGAFVVLIPDLILPSDETRALANVQLKHFDEIVELLDSIAAK